MSLTCSQMPLSCRYLTSSLVPLERGCVDKYKGFLNKFFQFRDLRSICSVGFEPNPMHNNVLLDLEEKYQRCGWRVSLCHHGVFYQVIWKRVELFWNVQLWSSIIIDLQVYIFPSTGVGSEDKSDVDYVYKKVIKHNIYLNVMFNLLFAKKNH